MSNNAATVKPENALPSGTGKNVTKFEYICLMLARIGGMFGTTLTGTLAAAFLHELYFGPAGVGSDEIAKILAVQTTLTTVVGSRLEVGRNQYGFHNRSSTYSKRS